MRKRFNSIKKILAAILITVSTAAFACKCASLAPISEEACNKYNVIFTGRVDSVSACNDKGLSIAHFTVDEVYKGSLVRQVKVEFDCSSSCLMSFSSGEVWLMYTNYEKFDLLTASLCSHTRKYFTEDTQDIYALSTQQTFEQEKQLLKKILGVQPFKETFQPSDVTGRNEQPSGTGKLVLLTISFAAMAVVYFIFRRKKHGK